MISKALSYSDLGITPADIYEQMGYGASLPDAATIAETSRLSREISSFLIPRFAFFVTDGHLDLSATTLSAVGRTLGIGRIISRQLKGSQRYAFFVATAGTEFEEFQHTLMREADMVRVFIADSIGSVIAEKTADRMEEALGNLIATAGWSHTNRFSPGYCGWDVAGQRDLFRLFPVENPCGISLTESCLMTPVKSVSGVIGLGPSVRKLEYSCGLCDFRQCYKRKAPPSGR